MRRAQPDGFPWNRTGDVTVYVAIRGCRPAAGRHKEGIEVRYGAFLEGRRVLVAEDEFLLALEVEAVLNRQGCVVLGPVATLDRALALLDGRPIDGAVLDVNLRGRRVTPLAAALQQRSVPFVLLTGYAERHLSEPELRAQPRLDKPLDGETLLHTLAFALRRE